VVKITDRHGRRPAPYLVGDGGLEGAVAPAGHYGHRVVTKIAATRSRLPSWLKSPAAVDLGPVPTGKG